MASTANAIQAPDIAAGYLSTRGSQIVDSSGTPVRLTGINWFGFAGIGYAPEGLWVDSYQDHMLRMKDLGFNVIRLPFSDGMLDPGRTPTTIDYRLNPDLLGLSPLEVMDKIVDYAGTIGMRIILDHHLSSTGGTPANPNGLWYDERYPESKMIENWAMLAARYAGKPAVVGADLHNEPHGPATWGTGQATDWDAAAERIGNAIQSVNKDWLIIVEGIEGSGADSYWWGGNLTGVRTHPVTLGVPNKLVYSTHDYSPSMQPMAWFRDPAFPNNLPDKWTPTWGYIFKEGIAPVLVGEFGSHHVTPADQAWMSKLLNYLSGDLDGNGRSDLAPGQQGISWTYWSWNPTSWDTGGILADDWTTINTAKADALADHTFGGSYLVTGTDRPDSIFPGNGNHRVEAGGGTDTLVLDKPRAAVQVGRSGADVTLASSAGTVTAAQVERIRFSDGTLIVAPTDPAYPAYRLYMAALGRSPDTAGLLYQADRLDQGNSLEDIAAGFIASPEFQQKYGPLSDSAYVEQLYRNVLGRAATADEIAYHVGRLEHGASRQSILVGFSESPENQLRLAPQIGEGIWYT